MWPCMLCFFHHTWLGGSSQTYQNFIPFPSWVIFHYMDILSLCLFTYQLMDIWVNSNFWLLWIEYTHFYISFCLIPYFQLSWEGMTSRSGIPGSFGDSIFNIFSQSFFLFLSFCFWCYFLKKTFHYQRKHRFRKPRRTNVKPSGHAFPQAWLWVVVCSLIMFFFFKIWTFCYAQSDMHWPPFFSDNDKWGTDWTS